MTRVRPPGFRRDIRPWQDLGVFVRYFAELTAFKVAHVGGATALVIGGAAEVRAGSWWGALLVIAGLSALLLPAWFWYYGVPEKDGSYRGQHNGDLPR